MKPPRLPRHTAAALVAGLFLAGLPIKNSFGQSGGPITILVPFSPASSPDIVARSLAAQMSEQTGEAVFVENKTGVSGGVGARFVARAEPDGHTLLMTADPPFTVTQFLQKQPLYEAIKDFSPVGELAAGQMALVVNASIKADSVQAFVRYAKQHAGDLNYGSPGLGTPQHLTMEFFKSAAGISIQHIPFKDAAGATTALLGGSVSTAFLPMPVAVPLPRDKVRILGVSSAARVPGAPDIPTISEQGYPGFEVYYRVGLLAPAGAPPGLLERYSKVVGAIVRSPDLAGKLATLGLVPVGSSPAEYSAVLSADEAKWRKVIADAKITPQD
jgi:tripartite-type tricarboxylate transporter receptor subunit TctC